MSFRRHLDRLLGWILVLLMAASVLNVLWQVFSRYVLRSPSSITEELARFLLIWVGLLGAAYAAGRNQHLAIELLPGRLAGRRATVFRVLVALAVLLFAAGIMLYGGTRLMLLQLHLGQKSAAMGLQLGWVYLAIPLSGAVMALYAVLNLVAPAGKEAAHGLD